MTGLRVVDYWYSGADDSTAIEFMEAVKLWGRDVFGRALEYEVGEEVIQGKAFRTYTVRLPAVAGPTGMVREPRITALSSSPSVFRGKGGDVCLDEFAIHKDQEELWAAAVHCANWGGVLRVISTHPMTPNKFDEIVDMGKRRLAGTPKPTDMDVSLHVIDIDRAINDGLVERINQTRGTTWTREAFRADLIKKAGIRADTELFCKTGNAQDSYLPYDLTLPLVRESLPGLTEDLATFQREIRRVAAMGTAVYGGCDVGRHSDRFAIAAVTVIGGMHLVGPVLVWQGKRFDAMELAINWLMESRLKGKDGGDRTVRRAAIDNAGLGMQLAERMEHRHRTRVEGVNTGTPAVREDIWTRVRAMSEERTLALPDDAALRGQLAGVKAIGTVGKHLRFDVERNEHGHGDAATAVALALHAASGRSGRAYFVEIEGGLV